MFTSIIPATGMTLVSILLCTLTSVGIGVLMGVVYRLTEKQSTNRFLITVIVLPVAVQAIIMMVNGNVGAGVAVAGAFSLVRFRSVPGTAKEICVLCCVMACGLATGMGHVLFAIIMATIMSVIFIVLRFTPFGTEKNDEKVIRILMPENLDYDEALKEVFEKYTSKAELVKVKTMELGSLYQLTYTVRLKSGVREKDIIDEIRIRNGNLTVNCFKADLEREKL